MAFPTKRLMEIVLNKDLAHNGHPVLRWMASNVAVKKDEAGNQKPDKEKSTEKIDGIVATIMALARAEVSNKEADDWDGEIFTF
jgi:phage terminase large subunit-like protein